MWHLLFSLPSSLYFNELSSEGRQALRDMGSTTEGGARVVVSLTEGTAVSEYWSVILGEVQRNLNSWDRGRVRRHLELLLRDLEDNRVTKEKGRWEEGREKPASTPLSLLCSEPHPCFLHLFLGLSFSASRLVSALGRTPFWPKS